VTIPLVDLHLQHRQVADDVAHGFAATLGAGDFVGGKAVRVFEEEYARYLGVGHCVGVGNGTDALELALRAVGVEAGDEVVLPVNTFIATAEAVARCGARPVLVDVDDDTLLITPEAVAAALGPRTRAVVPVHLYGQAAPVERLQALLSGPGVAVVEDAAQAQGARRLGRSAGTLGDIAATSFYPGKNLGAYGDAGGVLTDSPDLARAVRLLGAHGSETKYRHEVLGFNSRLDTLQAVVLQAKLRHLERWNDERRAAARRYDELLADLGPAVRTPVTDPDNLHVWHLYVVRVAERDRVLAALHRAGIGAGIHYPVPLHRTEAFVGLGLAQGSFPVAERAAGEILSLPLYPGITPSAQEVVAEALAAAVTGAAP
jgi:dTDP-4-amino-4,6-dideoxygalactose transaminase